MPTMHTPLLADRVSNRSKEEEDKTPYKICNIISYIVYILCIVFAILAIFETSLFTLNEQFIYIIIIGISVYGISQTLFGTLVECYQNRNFRFDEQALAYQLAKTGSFEMDIVNNNNNAIANNRNASTISNANRDLPALPNRHPGSVIDSIMSGLSLKRNQKVTTDRYSQTEIKSPFHLHLHYENVQLRPNCSILTNMRIGDIEHQIKHIPTKELSLMMPVIATIVSEIPFGMTVLRNRVIGILNERMANDVELQQSFQFFLHCFGHEVMVQKLWPAHWKLFEIQMKPFFQSLGKRLLDRRETLASEGGSLIDPSLLGMQIDEENENEDDPFADFKKNNNSDNKNKNDKNDKNHKSKSKNRSFFGSKKNKNKDKNKDKNKNNKNNKHNKDEQSIIRAASPSAITQPKKYLEPKYQAMKYDARQQGGATNYNEIQSRKRSHSLESGINTVKHLNTDLSIHKNNSITVREDNFVSFFYTAFTIANITPGFSIVAHRNVHIIDPINGQYGNFEHDEKNNIDNNINNNNNTVNMSYMDDVTVNHDLRTQHINSEEYFSDSNNGNIATTNNNNNNNNNNNSYLDMSGIDTRSTATSTTGKLDPKLIGKFGAMKKTTNSQIYKEIIIDQSNINQDGTPNVNINTIDIGVGTDDNNNSNNNNNTRKEYEIAHIQVRKIYTSNAKPLLFDMYVRNRINHKEIYRSSSFILKKGDDLRKDCGILYMFRFFNELWSTNDTNLRYNGNIVNALAYKCIAMGFGGANNIINSDNIGNNVIISNNNNDSDGVTINNEDLNFGVIEEISNCKNLKDIKGIIKSQKFKTKEISKLVTSAAGAYIGSFILGIRDRHYDNVLIRMTDGTLFHIDFGFCLGDKLKIDTSKLAITKDLQTLMGADWSVFVQLGVNAYMVLRQNYHDIIEFASIVFKYLYPSENVETFIYNKLRMDLTDDQMAINFIKTKLEKAPSKISTKLKNALHTIAQKS